jgi:hypothetical protein
LRQEISEGLAAGRFRVLRGVGLRRPKNAEGLAGGRFRAFSHMRVVAYTLRLV